MTIKLNDDTYTVADGTSLGTFARNLGLPPEGIAIAVDFEVVPRREWDDTVLEDGKELILIHAVCGG